MGLIRDALGSALGGNQVNNGFGGGPRLPMMNRISGRDNSNTPSSGWRQSQPPNQGYPEYGDYQDNRPYSDGRGPRLRSSRNDYRPDPRADPRYQMPMQQGYIDYQDQYQQPTRGYDNSPRDGQDWYQGQSYDARSYNGNSTLRRDGSFRPFVLPQISYGDGQPFLRGYSNELSMYGISREEFIRTVDTINVAIIPSPENQIFQKGANIAGWFLPGAAGIGLTVGQIGVGLGTAAGHASMLGKALSSANLQIFLPKGLEICIGKSSDVDAEVGIASQGSSRSDSSFNMSPEQRQAYYGDLVASLSEILPPLQQSGRSDPIAMLGRGLASRDSQKKMEKAQEKLRKGKTKDIDSLEGGLKWLMVRRATPDALARWEQTLQQSNAAMQQQQQAGQPSQSRYSRQ